MASGGLLLVLMMSAFFLISTVSVSTSANQNQHGESTLEKFKKTKAKLAKVEFKKSDDVKAVVAAAMPVLKDIRSVLKDTKVWTGTLSVLNVMPVIGSFFSLVLTIFTLIDKYVNDKSLLKDIKEEFDKIDLKLDQYHLEQKWETWAAGAYHKPELKIRTAWNEYKTLLGSLAGAKDDAERKRHEEHFKKSYLKYEKAPGELRELLKKQGTTFIYNLGDALAEHVKCHEKEIIRYTAFILMLIYKGNMMNQYYYRLKNIESKARAEELNKNVYEALSAMYEIHMQCIANSMTYVKQDVTPLIDKSKNRDAQAKEVWSFLKETYDRYDWMVVAFIKIKSSHKKSKTLNKHVLSGFTDVSTERITVAVARQVKGTHTRAEAVSKAIEKCVAEKVLCYKVAETLSTCVEKVAGIPMTQTYTAVHAYTKKAHQSIDTKEANPNAKASPKAKANPEDEEVNAAPETRSDQTPYIYTGKCQKSPGVKRGKFVVLIKSDEEMMGKDPCSKLDCGRNRGKCVPMKDMFLAMCRCNYPYYGQHCENDINDYGTELEKKAGTHRNPLVVKDRRVRTQHSNSRKKTS